MSEIFTIGHSRHPEAFFLQLLAMQRIQVVVDVRSVPYSRHAPAYNKNELEIFTGKRAVQEPSRANEPV